MLQRFDGVGAAAVMIDSLAINTLVDGLWGVRSARFGAVLQPSAKPSAWT